MMISFLYIYIHIDIDVDNRRRRNTDALMFVDSARLSTRVSRVSFHTFATATGYKLQRSRPNEASRTLFATLCGVISPFGFDVQHLVVKASFNHESLHGGAERKGCDGDFSVKRRVEHVRVFTKRPHHVKTTSDDERGGL
jgi:hypothetical protein